MYMCVCVCVEINIENKFDCMKSVDKNNLNLMNLP